ncbi:RNA polymerase sigma-70 factor [Olivibacter ginsenosidimutans]|uniref:RNA polymerase sigma-70 factor n=1 Tax=Olivibacter ginsenosidimutans TaxID=1176537 RepID=A0ABP9BWX9_9SPHI
MKLLTTATDEELFLLAKQGQEKAYAIIYDRYAAKLYAAAYRLLHDREVCEDLLQELFVHIWLKRQQLDIKNVRSYLYQSIRNSVLMALRKGRTHLAIDLAEDIATTQKADEEIGLKEINSLLHQQIEGLPYRCRQIFHMSRKEQLSNKEIADHLNISVKTVENQITLALQRLKLVFKEFL